MSVETQIERLAIVLNNLKFARQYTKSLLDGLTDEQWFWTPKAAVIGGNGVTNENGVTGENGFVTHVAWQVGHLAMAQYGLCLFRQRGRLSEDTNLMNGKFRKLFMKGTQPTADRAAYPDPGEIMAVLDRVFDQVMLEAPRFSHESLEEPIDPPTAAYETKFGALLMAVNHEMIHAGQIGVLRRLMGLSSVR